MGEQLPDRTEVLVVGAGPVGLAVAASLAGHGRDVTVVDRQAKGANTSRAAVIHARTLEMLERIGVSDRLTGLGIHASQFSIRDGDRELVPVRFDRLRTKYPYTLMVPQNITEQVLLDRLEELGEAESTAPTSPPVSCRTRIMPRSHWTTAT